MTLSIRHSLVALLLLLTSGEAFSDGRIGLVSLSVAELTQGTRAAPGRLDFPLQLKNKWTYHLHQELAEGVHFGSEQDAKSVKGSILDTTVMSAVTGSDMLHRSEYFRIESFKDGKLWLTEWYRAGAEGVLLGKTIDSEVGQETLMVPPQKVLSADLKPGDAWSWKAAGAPVTINWNVVGPSTIQVPAGRFEATQVAGNLKMQLDNGVVINVRQNRWFAPGVGYVKQETHAFQGDRLLSHSILTLEKFEPGQADERRR